MELERRQCDFLKGLEVSAIGSRGGLCLAWKDVVQVDLNRFSFNFIDVVIKGPEEDNPWRLTGFYGSPYVYNKIDS